MGPKIRTFYVDFMRLIPTLMHFLAPKKLKDQFGFFLNPDLYHREYLTQATEKHPHRCFIKSLGSLRPLAPPRWRYSFWRNLFRSTLLTTYVNHYLREYFGYLPYIISPSWRIHIEPSSRISQSAHQLLSRAKVALTARLFPMGAISVHLMAFFTSNQAEVEEFVEMQKMLSRHRLFRVTRRRYKDSRLLSLQQIFEEIQNLVYKSLYTEPPHGDHETWPQLTHRVIYFHLLQADGLAKAEIELAAASLIGLKPLRTHDEADIYLKNKVKKPKVESKDLLAFHPMATLLYAPNLDPYKEGYCLWNNYLNVVELASIQKFVLEKACDLLEGALKPSREFIEFADRASFLQGLARGHQYLRGGHKGIYICIDQKFRLSKLVKRFSDLLDTYRETKTRYEPYELICDQIQRIQRTLEEMENVADTTEVIPPGIDILLDWAIDIHDTLVTHVWTLREIARREQRGIRLQRDTRDELNAMRAILDKIRNYGRNFLPDYERRIEELLDNEQETARIDVTKSRNRLKEAKRIRKSLSFFYDSAQAFVKDATEYVEALLDAAAKGLENLKKTP